MMEQPTVRVPAISKKEQILTLFRLGMGSIGELAWLTQSTTSYVSSVLREAGVLRGYFDLYTSSDRPMNVYSRYFEKKLGFKDVTTARQSVAYISTLYQQFARIQDRAGQHHALLMALTMHNRAAWSGKRKEARVYGKWLSEQLQYVEQEGLPAVADKAT